MAGEPTSDEMEAKIEAELKAEEARARVLALQIKLKWLAMKTHP